MLAPLTMTAVEKTQAFLDAERDPGASQPPVVMALGFTDVLGAEIGDEVGFPTPPGATTVHLHGRDAYLLAASDERPSPCARCFHRRWQAIRNQEERDALEVTGSSSAVPSDPWLTPLALTALRALVAERDVDRAERPVGTGTIRRLRLDTLATSTFPLLADPDCPQCGSRPEAGPHRAIVPLERRQKRRPDSFRQQSVTDYDIDPRAFANPVCGALGSVMNAAFDNPTTMPVTGVSLVRGAAHIHEFFWSGHADCTRDSQLLAILEGLERYAGLLSRGLPDPIWSSLEGLRAQGTAALDPRECTLYPDRFYERFGAFYTAFTPDLEVPWVWGQNLTTQRPTLVPQRLVHYLDQAGPAFVDECSNGCATGASPQEAIFHGLLELIERDSFLLTWFARHRADEVDPMSSGAEDIDLMIARMRLEGFEVRMFDTRIDLPIPVISAVAVRQDDTPGRLCYAAGSSPDPVQAMRAALCEISSYVPSFERRMADGAQDAKAMEADYSQVGELKHHALLHGLESVAAHSDFLLGEGRARAVAEVYEEWERDRPRHRDLTEDLQWLLDMFAERGFEVFAVDQTTAEQRALGLSTYATIVPGLVPIDFGWTKQRGLEMDRVLTAHHEAGLRDRPLERDELNPVPHPFP
ncbi:TOMM precursor leader peptide-binding protein [Brachybacterium sp. DNPG3]